MKITYDDLFYYSSFQEFTKFLLPLLLPHTGTEAAMITCHDGNSLKIAASAGNSPAKAGTSLAADEEIKQILPGRQGELLLIEDTSHYPELNECMKKLGVRSSMSVPIVLSEDNPCGFLHLFSTQPQKFSTAAQDRVKQAALVIGRSLMLEHQAVHDSLTGTFNKEFLVNYFHQVNAPAALYHIKIENLPDILKKLGREEAEQVLQDAALRLKQSAGREAVTASLREGEFLLLFFRDISRETLAGHGAQIQEAFSKKFFSEKTPVKLSVSIGVSRSPADSRSIEDLLYFAEVALYESRKHAKHPTVFYHTGIKNERTLEKTIVEDLPKAFQNNEFSLVYQPQFDSETMELRAVEAFIRWQHPVLGYIPPADFLPPASRSGLIKHIDQWVIEEGCRTAASLQHKYPLSLSLNVASFAYYPEELTTFIFNTLKRTGLSPGRLELELTETEGHFPLKETKTSLETLQQAGLRTAIGNFGSGDASFNAVQSLPLHTLKLDRSFTKKMLEDKEQEKVVEQMITVAHMFDVIVVGEGVESSLQWQKLNALGCDYVQGYYCGKPVPLSILESFLEHDPTFSNAYDPFLQQNRSSL
jgi:diguanylate cyclase (GGDEF)-like protein